ncbi:MAG TPA: tetratricopeptide repeat protein [Bryobacteraceae bacterium]|nr:tetratricopeptide repeat protein [Bryobacteraceae bacterium]
MRLTAVFFLALAAFAQTKQPEQTKQPDMCAPPPSSAAPSLPAHLMTGQGDVHFKITTSSPEAQKFFDQGVAQMHSFWAVEAERSFRQAAELDPAAPMPWWGVAMVAAGDYRPRFQLDTYDKVFGRQNPLKATSRAVEAAEKAKELAAADGKASPLEKLYIASIAARRNLNSKDPDGDYIQGLRAIAAQYPDEVEARTYLALHLMRGYTTPDKQPKETTMEAVTILRDLLVKAPDHPGVHHYVIHAWEGSSFAKEAWPSCKRYAELVPNIPHALHMPGHIYSQTGRWDDAVKSFADAADNERGYMKADKLYGTGHHGHNVHYLATAYSFEGEYDKAEEAARELLGFKENPREAANIDGFFSAYRQGWFAMMRTLVQGERWDEILDGKTLPIYDKPREQAWRHWAMAVAYSAKGNVALAEAESKLMDNELKEYKARVKMPVPEVLETARIELEGHLKLAEGKIDAGLNKLQAAADHELHLVYSEPPYYPRPVLEVLGEAALKNGKNKEAATAFQRALEQYPQSHRAQVGLRAALQGNQTVAKAAGR